MCKISIVANFFARPKLFFYSLSSLLEPVPFFYLCVVYEGNDKKQTGHLATACLHTTISVLLVFFLNLHSTCLELVTDILSLT